MNEYVRVDKIQGLNFIQLVPCMNPYLRPQKQSSVLHASCLVFNDDSFVSFVEQQELDYHENN